MYGAAEQQLTLVTRKSQRLREALRQQIQNVKTFRVRREKAIAARDEIRRELQKAEEIAAAADAAHHTAEDFLRRTAKEFASTQLLQKRYENILAEMNGRQRAIVRVATVHTNASPQSIATFDTQEEIHNIHNKEELQSEGDMDTTLHKNADIAVTDDCTVVELDRRRTFVVDVAYSTSSLHQRMKLDTYGNFTGSTMRNSTSSTSVSPSYINPNDEVLKNTSMNDEELMTAIGMDRVIADVLSGVNTVFFTFGPVGGGKTETLFGTRAALIEYEKLQKLYNYSRPFINEGKFSSFKSSSTTIKDQTEGLLSLFVHGLFNQLSTHAITHVNIRCSFAEIAMNQTIDLLLRQPNLFTTDRTRSDSQVIVKHVSAVAGDAVNVQGISEEVSSVKVDSAEAAMQIFFDGIERLGRWRRAINSNVKNARFTEENKTQKSNSVNNLDLLNNNNSGVGVCGVSHVIFTLTVESFNEKGHYRRANVSFVDLCGPPSSLSKQSSLVKENKLREDVLWPMTPESQWAEESLRILYDVIAATSDAQRDYFISQTITEKNETARNAKAAFDRIPSTHTNCLTRFLRPIFGGNAKAIMICCLDVEKNSKQQVLNSLSYAYFFKRIQHQAVPYDIPPELQQLNLQMNAFLSTEDYYNNNDNDSEYKIY